MSTGKLPEPQAAGPVAGQPGHFAHHDWLGAAVAVLDERLFKKFTAVVVTTTLVTNVWTAIKYDTVVYDSGLDIDLDAVAGGVVMGPGAPEGYYRLDTGTSFAGNATGSRRARVTVNGVDDPAFYTTGAALPTAAWAMALSSGGILYLPPLAIVKVEGMQNTGANLLTNATSQTRLNIEYLGVGPPPGAAGAAAEEQPA